VNRGGRPPLSTGGTVRISITLPAELAAFLDRMARELNVSLAEAVRRCLPDLTPPKEPK
jgi:hypothetical protein